MTRCISPVPVRDIICMILSGIDAPEAPEIPMTTLKVFTSIAPNRDPPKEHLPWKQHPETSLVHVPIRDLFPDEIFGSRPVRVWHQVRLVERQNRGSRLECLRSTAHRGPRRTA